MNSPFFSVVIPLYNKSGYIERTVKSVLAQSFADFELVIVDDGSSDDGPAKVQALGDPRIRLVRQQNGGVSAARNRGIKEASGAYIAFLDADDEWLPGKLEAHHDFSTRHPECRWGVSGFKRRYREREAEAKFCDTQVLPDALAAMGAGLVVWTGAVVARRECFQEDCLFPVGISRSEDREVWLKLACRYPAAGYIGEALAVYHVDTPGSLTNTASVAFDFSFFDLAGRLEPFLAGLPGPRQQMLQKYLNDFNRRACLSFTVSNPGFFDAAREEVLRRHLTASQYLLLKTICPWPGGVKRVLARLLHAVGFF